MSWKDYRKCRLLLMIGAKIRMRLRSPQYLEARGLLTFQGFFLPNCIDWISEIVPESPNGEVWLRIVKAYLTLVLPHNDCRAEGLHMCPLLSHSTSNFDAHHLKREKEKRASHLSSDGSVYPRSKISNIINQRVHHASQNQIFCNRFFGTLSISTTRG